MSITVKEIAKLAGVSRGSVDRALKDRPGINTETKERILAIAKKYNYTPNLIGKALVYSGHKIAVDVIINSLGNSFFDEIKRGILTAQNEFSGYGITINFRELKGYDVDEQLSLLSSIDSETKNIILTPIDDEKISDKINELTARGINVITLSSDIENSKRLSYVGCDYLKSGEIAGRLIGLLSLGKANLCIVTGTKNHIGHKMRIDGIKSIVEKEYDDINIIDVIENQDDNEIAYENMKNSLENNPSIDFVYITAGGVSGTIRAIKENERKIKVCSFDDTVTTREALLNGNILATICQQPFEQGYNAVKLIFDFVVAKKEIAPKNYSDLYIKVDKSI